MSCERGDSHPLAVSRAQSRFRESHTDLQLCSACVRLHLHVLSRRLLSALCSSRSRRLQTCRQACLGTWGEVTRVGAWKTRSEALAAVGAPAGPAAPRGRGCPPGVTRARPPALARTTGSQHPQGLLQSRRRAQGTSRTRAVTVPSLWPHVPRDGDAALLGQGRGAGASPHRARHRGRGSPPWCRGPAASPLAAHGVFVPGGGGVCGTRPACSSRSESRAPPPPLWGLWPSLRGHLPARYLRVAGPECGVTRRIPAG